MKIDFDKCKEFGCIYVYDVARSCSFLREPLCGMKLSFGGSYDLYELDETCPFYLEHIMFKEKIIK